MTNLWHRPVVIRLLLVLMLPALARSQGPKVVASEIGTLWRYQGDTIWNERDSTIRRTIFRGDTVFKTWTIDGRVRSSESYLVVGDSARGLTAFDSLGRPGRTGQVMPARMLFSDREQIAREMQSAELRARMTQLTGNTSPTAVPISPPDPQTYCVDASTNIIQLRDTARYVRTLTSGRVDTTTFVFIGDTTVRRIAPTPRTFGYAMANTIIGEMHMALVRKSLDARAPAAAATLPGRAPRACGK